MGSATYTASSTTDEISTNGSGSSPSIDAPAPAAQFRTMPSFVGRAEGARLEDSLPDDIVASARRAPRDTLNSMAADRIAGRPTEHDARNGVIVRLGRKHGIAAPMNALMVALLEAAQDGTATRDGGS